MGCPCARDEDGGPASALARYGRSLATVATYSGQEKQVVGITDDVRTRWKALYTPLDAEREQMRLQGRQKIRSILTPEQQPKFDEYIRRLDEQRKKDAEAAAAAAAQKR